MNYVNRSILSIKKRKNRSIILFLAVLLICNVMAGSISVKKALLKTKESFSNIMPIEVTIDEDYTASDESINTLTEEIVNKIGLSSYVKKYTYTYLYTLGSRILVSGSDDVIVGDMVTDTLEDNEYKPFNAFSIYGVAESKFSEIANNEFKITTGNTFSNETIDKGDNVVLVSKEFAGKNSLTVGDKIKLGQEISNDFEDKNYGTIEEEYTIIGIFEVETKYGRDTSGNVIELDNEYVDNIYMPNNALKNIHEKIEAEKEKYGIDNFYGGFQLLATYELTSIDDLEDFKNENINLLPKNFEFNDNSEKYNNSIAPMENMEDLSKLIVYASILASIIITCLISILFCKERKQEMGIYLALGEKKKNIALQILIETLIVSFVAITISMFTGNILAKNISNKMLQNQITAKNTELEENNYYTEIETIDIDEVTSNYNVSLDLNTVFIIYAVSLGSIIVSTILPIYYTLKLNPRKILM